MTNRQHALRRRLGVPVAAAAIVATCELTIAFSGGGYTLATRCSLAIGALWAIALASALGMIPRLTKPVLALVAGLVALAAWDLASMAWASDTGAAYDEFARTVGYAAVAAVVAILARQVPPARIADGLALAASVVGIAALLTRLFPRTFPGSNIGTYLPGAVTRLSYPLNYWNGLGILLAIAVPLLLRIAVHWRGSAASSVAVAQLPLIGVCIYFTSSRGALAALLVGVVAFLALVPDRWAALAAIVPGIIGGAAAVAAVHRHPVLVNGPFDSQAAVSAGRQSALLILAAAVLAGAGHRLLVRLGAGRSLDRRIGWATSFLLVGGACALIVAAHPVARFEAFKRPAYLDPASAPVEGHLLSGTGSGRWQLWRSALDQWRTQPVHGQGAGSYAAWWAQHGTLPAFVTHAHSLYLETLGELGIVGFACLLLIFGGALAGGVLAYRRIPDRRVTIAALSAAGIAFALALGVDWMWELPAVGVAGFAVLVSLTSMVPAGPPRSRPRWAKRASATALALVALLLVVAEMVPLLADARVNKSQLLVQRNDLPGAYQAALDARAIEPWAATPRLQLALVAEAAGREELAVRWIREAITRSPDDWRLWLVEARLETRLGRIAAARRALDRARTLNARSTIFLS